VGPCLERIAAEVAICSPLRRAWQTLELSGWHPPRVEFDSRAVEVSADPDFYRSLDLPLRTPAWGSADTHAAWFWNNHRRVGALLNDVLGRKEQRVLLIGHWALFDAIARLFLDIEAPVGPTEISTWNTGLCLLEVDGGGCRRVRYWNDHAHVRDLIT
jgi:broad specificity phosphatase PhoE